MKNFDETQLKALLLRGEKLKAIQLLRQQTDIDLREAKSYIDDFCLRENINSDNSEVSYYATMENAESIYYRSENGNKHVIPKEEASNHKKARKILVCLSLLSLILSLFFLYQVFTISEPAFSDIGGLIASVLWTVTLYIILFLLWLDDRIATGRKKRADEMEIPAEFFIKGRTAKGIFIFTSMLFFVLLFIWLCFSVVMFYAQMFVYEIFCLIFFILFIMLFFYETFLEYQISSLSLHIRGQTICIYKGKKEISTVQATDIRCEFIARSKKRGKTDLYTKALLIDSTGKLIAKIFLDLPEYHLLKKYMQQQGVLIRDDYNRF